MTGLLAVTVIGHDRPGIIADATSALAELGGNLEDSTMTILRGHFTMVLLVVDDGTARRGRGRAGAAHRRRDAGGLRARAARGAAGRAAGVTPYLLSVHGADRPGIVVGGHRRSSPRPAATSPTSRPGSPASSMCCWPRSTCPATADVDSLRAAAGGGRREALDVEASLTVLDSRRDVTLLPPLPERAGARRSCARRRGSCRRAAAEVDPLDPAVVALAADLLATQRVVAGLRRARRAAGRRRAAGVLARRHRPPEGAYLPRRPRAGRTRSCGRRLALGARPGGLHVGART